MFVSTQDAVDFATAFTAPVIEPLVPSATADEESDSDASTETESSSGGAFDSSSDTESDSDSSTDSDASTETETETASESESETVEVSTLASQNEVPMDFSMEGYAILATAAWWLRLGSLGLAEYAAPFLAFDETTLAAVAGFNSVVDVLDVDFANAISNTALSTPSMLLLYTLFAAEVTTGDDVVDQEIADMFANAE
jgi:hypothetical protein